MVSLIIPVHNRKELLPRLFASLRRIEGCEVEIIFVDNNSDADTHTVLQAFVDEIGARLLTEAKPGAAAARNAGLDAATGDYVYFFDSDDELSPEMLRDAETLARSADVDAVGLQVVYINPDGSSHSRHFIRSADPRRHVVANNFATVSLFLRRSFAQAHGRWNESLFYWIDFEWAFRILLARPSMAWLTKPYHRIHVHPDSITGTRFADRVDKILSTHQALEDDIKQLSILDSQFSINRALNSRKALYAGHIRHEGNRDAAYLIYNSIRPEYRTFLDRLRLSLLYWLSAWGVPGVWRLA
ncbi:MAG: glycosyltransferase [Bacteroidaceae bacterium]|nr:glycosyltransferase [Bacteroidaceae bacterium]